MKTKKKNLTLGNVFLEESGWQKGLFVTKLVFAIHNINENDQEKYILCVTPEWNGQLPWFKNATQLQKYIQGVMKENIHKVVFFNKIDKEKTPVCFYQVITNNSKDLDKEVEVKM